MATTERWTYVVPPEQYGRGKGPHLWEIQAILDLLFLFAVGVLLWFVYELRGVFMPVLVALALAYLLDPLITWFQRRWSVPRPATIAVLLMASVAAGAVFVAWVSPLLIEQVQALARKTPGYLQTLGGRYGVQFDDLTSQLLAWTSLFQEDPIGALQPVFTGTGHAIGFIGTVIGTTTYIAVVMLLIPIYFFFFAWRFQRIGEVLTRLIPASRRQTVWDIAGKIDEAISGFFRGRVLIAIITGALYAAGWAWTEVPYWFLLGAGTGLLSIIPYVSVIGWPLAILLKYLDVMSNAQAVEWMSIVVLPSVPYLIVQFFESWWLTPWIEGHTTNLSSVTIIIVVFIGGAVGGFFGLLLAIPVAASCKILLQDLIMPRWEGWAARR